MKKITFILFTLFVLSACSSDTTTEPIMPVNTKLELTVFDENNNPITNQQVKIFLTENDYLNNINSQGISNTNSGGKVLFENLSNNIYYWKIGDICFINNDDTNTINSLTPNTTNTFTVNLTNNQKGNLTIQNNSTSTYVYTLAVAANDINNILPLSGSIPPNSSLTYNNISTGTYNFMFTNDNGSIIISANFNLNCSENKTIILP